LGVGALNLKECLDLKFYKNGFFFNPYWGEQEKFVFSHYQDNVKLRQGLWGFPTSGTSGFFRYVIHTDSSLVDSAQMYCRHFSLSDRDIIFNCLPSFHVGGQLPRIRAAIVSAGHVTWNEKWNAFRASLAMQEAEATVTSLVPTQLKDIVTQGVEAPEQLRLVHIGGGRLQPEIFRKAVDLGWPISVSYGMTETAAMIYASSINEASLFPIGNVQGRIGEEGSLWVQSPSLALGEIYFHPSIGVDFLNYDLQVGYWKTADLAVLHPQGELEVLGRRGRVLKILGELVSLDNVETELGRKFGIEVQVKAVDDARRGYVLHGFVIEPTQETQVILKEWNKNCSPFQRLESLSVVQNQGKRVTWKQKLS
jgi:O-succinylbenzoic acid--CoA ligase